MPFILQLFACFALWTAALMAVFEAYAWLLRCMASLPRKLPLWFGYSLYCVIGGVSFGLPFMLLLEQIPRPELIPALNQPQIAIGVFATVNGSPILAYWFFQRRHMASLKELGYFLPINRQKHR